MIRGPVLAVAVNSAAMACVHVVLRRRPPSLRWGWFRVRAWEPPLWRRCGVAPFARLLELTGWSRVVAAQRRFDGTRARLAALDHHTRLSEFAHLLVAGAGLLVAAVMTGAGARVTAAWVAVVTVALHVHPVLLQRSVRARIARLTSP